MTVRFRAANGIELAADVDGPWDGFAVVELPTRSVGRGGCS